MIKPEPLEQHFTVSEVADAWKLDPTTVRRIFIDEPGVLKIGNSTARPGKRSYVTLRIPSKVLERVHQRRMERGGSITVL